LPVASRCFFVSFSFRLGGLIDVDWHRFFFWIFGMLLAFPFMDNFSCRCSLPVLLIFASAPKSVEQNNQLYINHCQTRINKIYNYYQLFTV
jgi:hypothetical protein